MGGVQGIRDLDGQRQRGLGVHGPPGDAMLQRNAIQKLHGDEGLVFVLADLVNGADIGMIQGRGGTGLAAESFKRVRHRSQTPQEELERDKAA